MRTLVATLAAFGGGMATAIVTNLIGFDDFGSGLCAGVVAATIGIAANRS